MSFNELQRNVVKDFLHTAVLIDDKIDWPSNDIFPPEIIDSEIVEPDEFDDTFIQNVEGVAAPISAPIKAKEIIKSFSDLGIVCSPYLWEYNEQNFPIASEKADLLILDWKLESDSQTEKGINTTKFIKERLQKDIENRERLRFISIYTSETSADIIPALETELATINKIDLVRINDETLDIISSSGHRVSRIIVISKNQVQEDQLAGELINSFTNFVNGFLPNILLSSVSEIRNRTFEYLAQYHSNLDLAILSHFAALKSQEKTCKTAEIQFRDYVTNLIANGIHNSIAFSDRLKESSSFSTIKKYLTDTPDIKIYCETLSCNDLKKILSILKLSDHSELSTMVRTELNLNSSMNNKFKSGKSSLLFDSSETIDSFLELSSLDLLTRSYQQKVSSPPLRLGTIIKDKNSGTYYLCIQPLCDGVRLDDHQKEYSFPFLKLAEDNKKFSIVIPYQEKHKTFSCETKTQNIFLFKFKSNTKTDDIRARKYGKSFFPQFRTSDKKQSFLWLGELRDIYAQEIINALAHQGSRVGSDKFEWLRKKS